MIVMRGTTFWITDFNFKKWIQQQARGKETDQDVLKRLTKYKEESKD